MLIYKRGGAYPNFVPSWLWGAKAKAWSLCPAPRGQASAQPTSRRASELGPRIQQWSDNELAWQPPHWEYCARWPGSRLIGNFVPSGRVVKNQRELLDQLKILPHIDFPL